MAIANRVKPYQFNDGTGENRSGVPAMFDRYLPTQNAQDVRHSVRVELVHTTANTDIVYPPGGFPLAWNTGTSAYITPDGDTELHLYKFSHFLAREILNRQDARGLVILAVNLDTVHAIDPAGDDEAITQCIYDRDNDKLRMFRVDGTEVASGDVIRTEAAAKKLAIQVDYI